MHAALVAVKVRNLCGPELAAGLVARVIRPPATVRACVHLEVARRRGPFVAAILVARVRPLTAVRTLVALEDRWLAVVALYYRSHSRRTRTAAHRCAYACGARGSSPSWPCAQ
jgi:hypothetical protein